MVERVAQRLAGGVKPRGAALILSAISVPPPWRSMAAGVGISHRVIYNLGVDEREPCALVTGALAGGRRSEVSVGGGGVA